MPREYDELDERILQILTEDLREHPLNGETPEMLKAVVERYISDPEFAARCRSVVDRVRRLIVN